MSSSLSHWSSSQQNKCIFPHAFVGMIWAEVKEIWSQGPGEYLVEPWNFLDFGMLAIFLASFCCRFSALRHADLAQTYVHTHYTTLINVTLPPEIHYFTLGEHAQAPTGLLSPMSR